MKMNNMNENCKKAIKDLKDIQAIILSQHKALIRYYDETQNKRILNRKYEYSPPLINFESLYQYLDREIKILEKNGDFKEIIINEGVSNEGN